MIYNLERTLEEEFQKREARGEAKGEARGEARGKAEGEARGRAEGKAEGKAELIIKLLKKKFAAVPEEYIEKIKKQDNDALEAIGDNILNMQDINELDKYLKE
jgi:predicted transposase YdaD